MEQKINEVVIVIPIYKEKLTKFEKISLEQCKKVLAQYSQIFLAPQGLNLADYQMDDGSEVKFFDDNYFKNIKGYNQLMLSTEMYERFSAYKYMLIYQLDAFVFSDSLVDFTNMDYDYIGAPWIDGMPYYKYNFKGSVRINKMFPFINRPTILSVGNGGLSLRNVESTIKALEDSKKSLSNWKDNEDKFFSLYGINNPEKFKVAPIDIALNFSFETYPCKCYKMNSEKLPFGCHAWEKYDIDFMRKIFWGFGYKI